MKQELPPGLGSRLVLAGALCAGLGLSYPAPAGAADWQDAGARSVSVSAGQTGMASYYGRQFFGRRTASGATMDPTGYHAAHRTLPFGTLVEVTNLRNGRRIVVRINDRGPFSRGRVVDLTPRGAQALGFAHAGIAPVRVSVLSQTAELGPRGARTLEEVAEAR